MSINQSNEGEFKNFWQLVFNQSRVNGAKYFGDCLPSYSWEWPKNTFLQTRLSKLRNQQSDKLVEIEPQSRKPLSSLNRKRRPAYHEQPNWLHGTLPTVEEH
ncbi:MAG: hypothetical protein OEN50_08330 [Deltaproteobacteria bacterium]|nr:hypothetical protein [Deltaproteobacteria bacterium]